MIPESWLADRCSAVEVSGVREMFELAWSLKDPVNLSIGQPHFDVPEPLKAAAKAAIDGGHNGYTVTQGIPTLLAAMRADVQRRFPGQERDVLVTSGTSGGLLLTLLAAVNPGEEVITTDPYFVSYPNLVAAVGGRLVTVDTYPDFTLDVNRLADAITPRTKAVMLSTPCNPTGAVIATQTQKQLAELCHDRRVLLISDEIYRAFQYELNLTSPPEGELAPRSGAGGGEAVLSAPTSPANFNPNVLVIEGFGKTYGMTGWRLGWAHGPKRLIQEMTKLQQFTFVCAPSMVQHAGVAAMNYDVGSIIAEYRRKRDMMVAGLKDHYELRIPGGAFYLFPKVPWGTATEFVKEAIKHNLLIIPGKVFSGRDTHVRISYAATDATLQRGIELLRKLAKR